jgi:ankyrin repeat protein
MSLPNRRRPLLLSQINTPDRSGRTPLFKFLSYPSTTLLLLENGASPLIKDNAGYTPLHEACVQGEVEGARLVLMYGADVNACGGMSYY